MAKAIRGARVAAARALRFLLPSLLLTTAPSIVSAQAAGDRIVNIATVTFTGTDGSTGTLEAQSVIFLRQLAGVTVTQAYDVVRNAGTRAVLAHVVTNTGTGADRLTLQVFTTSTWPVSLYMDVDGDGQLSAADTAITAPLSLARGASAPVLMVANIPAAAPEGVTQQFTLRAVSQVDATVAGVTTDRLAARRVSAPDLVIAKTANRTDVTVGDTIDYTITITNRGGAPTATPVEVVDNLPVALRLVPGSVLVNGAAMDVVGSADVRVSVGIINADASVQVTLRAVVVSLSDTDIANVATASFGDGSGTTSAVTTARSSAAISRVTPAVLDLSKELVGADSIILGRDVTYRLRYANRSTTTEARNVVLVDSLPAELDYVSSSPPGTVNATGRVITWNIGTIAPNGVAEVMLVTRAARKSVDGTNVVNNALLSGGNAARAAVSAASIRLGDFVGGELVLAKTAGVLDAAIGEAIPYSIALQNKSIVSIRDVIVHDVLPEGVNFARGSVRGADSVQVNGRDITFFVSSIPATSTTSVQYAAILMNAGNRKVVENKAFASAEGGRLKSDTSTAWVRVRSGFEMQGRTLIGKVWVDRNDNGRQEPGELGLSNAHVMTADGQIIVTDKEGRFSLRDVRPGTHALRLDTLGVPGTLKLERAEDEIAVIHTDGWTMPQVNFRLVPAFDSTACADSLRAGLLTQAAFDARMGRRGENTRLEIVSVRPMRTEADRLAEENRAFVEGPVVRVATPVDGAVFSSNRAYFRVKGEPNAPVKLFDGARKIAETALRPDGTADFIGLELSTGPHVIRVSMKNSFGRERWDSIAVHRSGEAVSLDVPTVAQILRQDATEALSLKVRVLDEWGVPLATNPMVTVESKVAVVDGTDNDPSSVGEQRQVGVDGVAEIMLRAGRSIGDGDVLLSSGRARGRVPVRVLPSIRPLVATGVGQIGAGAGPQSFGAVTVRGAIGDETSVSMSYDSRRSSDNDFFARGFDPLEQARYPLFGDASEQRAMAASTQRFSARVERRLDWFAVGDVQTDAFGSGRLTSYSRSLNGVSGQVTGGNVTVSGFASVTRQTFGQSQLRGDGGSGPYVFGKGIRAGTDRIAIEVRDRDNTARVMARQELTRFTDYQIDYATGAILLRNPVPSIDPYGNPIFVVATMEQNGGADQQLVGGLRAQTEVGRYLSMKEGDSLMVGVSTVRGGNNSNATTIGSNANLLGADAHLVRNGLDATAELLQASAGDSSAIAARAGAKLSLGEMGAIDFEWLKVTGGFDRSLDPRLAAGLSQVTLGGSMKLSNGSTLGIHGEQQTFEAFGVSRRVIRADAEQRLFGRSTTQEINLATDSRPDAASLSTLTGKFGVALDNRTSLWAEGVHSLGKSTDASYSRPDQIGMGASYRLFDRLSLTASHRQVKMDTLSYALSSIGFRSEGFFGGQAWTNLERAASNRAQDAAVLGWNQRISIGKGWSMSTMFERRVGLSKASLADPNRGLPFAQAEPNRTSVGGGFEWLPGSDKSRFSARAEYHNGADRVGQRIEIAGDMPLGLDAAMLTYTDLSQYMRNNGATREMSRQDRSLVGVALRPTGSDLFNALMKIEWRRSLNPLGSLLSSTAQDSRLIGAADAVYSPMLGTEIAARYAVRFATVSAAVNGDVTTSNAHYVGLRADRALRNKLSLRADARALLENRSGSFAWSAAPSLVYRLDPRIEFESGYRVGPLADPDFATNARTGLFVSMSVRFTERAFAGPAAFWRERIARQQ